MQVTVVAVRHGKTSWHSLGRGLLDAAAVLVVQDDDTSVGLHLVLNTTFYWQTLSHNGRLDPHQTNYEPYFNFWIMKTPLKSGCSTVLGNDTVFFEANTAIIEPLKQQQHSMLSYTCYRLTDFLLLMHYTHYLNSTCVTLESTWAGCPLAGSALQVWAGLTSAITPSKPMINEWMTKSSNDSQL